MPDLHAREFKVLTQKQHSQEKIALALALATLLSLGFLLWLLSGNPNAALTALLGGLTAGLAGSTSNAVQAIAGTSILDYMSGRLGTHNKAEDGEDDDDSEAETSTP